MKMKGAVGTATPPCYSKEQESWGHPEARLTVGGAGRGEAEGGCAACHPTQPLCVECGGSSSRARGSQPVRAMGGLPRPRALGMMEPRSNRSGPLRDNSRLLFRTQQNSEALNG